MDKNQSSYRQIFKATSIFGGIQIVSIIVGIIRSKFVAVLLGPSGMGVVGLLNSAITMVEWLTKFGLSTSAVKDISAAYGSGNSQRISQVVKILRRVVWFTGLFGSFITLIFSSLLSKITFGNYDYTYAFVLISVTLLLNQISSGQGVVLRGMRKIKYVSQSTLIGGILGLFTTIPLYYFFGQKGIVPGIIVSSVSSLLLTWHYSRKVKIEDVYVSKARTIAEAKGMLKLGFMISLSGIISTAGSYLIRIYISNVGGIEEVGFYNAGFAITKTYVGMIFAALSVDFYPKLAGVVDNVKMYCKEINQQIEITLLILSPIIVVFLIFINWVVVLLYSSEFTPINQMILWAVIGMLFKGLIWPVTYLFLAKGDGKTYFWNEFTYNILFIVSNIVFYNFFGLTGLGYAFLATYVVYLFQVYFISKSKWNFEFDSSVYKIFLPQLAIALITLSVSIFFTGIIKYTLGTILICISVLLAFKKLNMLLDIKGKFKALLR